MQHWFLFPLRKLMCFKYKLNLDLRRISRDCSESNQVDLLFSAALESSKVPTRSRSNHADVIRMLRNSELFNCAPESELHFLPKRPSSSPGEARRALHATVFTAPSLFFLSSFRRSKPNIFVTGEAPCPKSPPHLPPPSPQPSPCNRSPC